MEIICVNSEFDSYWTTYFNKYGIITPKEGEIYTIRKLIKYKKGEKGLLLNEIINKDTPKIGLTTGVKGMSEQTWAISRFRTLLDQTLTEEMIDEQEKEQKAEQKGLLIKRLDTNNPYEN